MAFTAPLGLLALLAIPAIVAIHLFRRRFPIRPVAGLFLWKMQRQTPDSGGRIDRLPITTSLILECLAALALALIIAGARLSSEGVSQHLVVLLDDSASMSAVNARNDSARDRAVERIVREMARLGSAALLTVVQSGERPSVLFGPAAHAVQVRAALQAWVPQAPDHSLALSIRLARELAGRTGRLMVLSDVSPRARGEGSFDGGLWVALGEPLTNVGITAAERSLSADEGRSTVSLTLVNNAAEPAPNRVTVSAAGKAIAARDLEVPAGVSSLTLPLPSGLPLVRVSLTEDALRRDNEVALVEPRPQVVGVENRLSKALAALRGIARAELGARRIR